jgi:hypothetical protein
VIAVFTPTTRYGGLDVNRASLLAQNHDSLVWIVGDDLYPQRDAVRFGGPIRTVHFDTGANKRANNAPSSLATAYRRGIEIARELDVDLLVSMQDYLWIPPDGLSRFERMAEQFPTALLTGLCSLSDDPGVEAVTDPEGPYTIFAEPYDGHKPQRIGWRDCRLERWPVGVKANAGSPIWWETNWAAIPRKILYDTRLNFDDAYDRGYAYENQDYASRAMRLGYGVWIDTGNHAIGLPHTHYFPAETEHLRSISNREWHESRWAGS